MVVGPVLLDDEGFEALNSQQPDEQQVENRIKTARMKELLGISEANKQSWIDDYAKGEEAFGSQ